MFISEVVRLPPHAPQLKRSSLGGATLVAYERVRSYLSRSGALLNTAMTAAPSVRPYLSALAVAGMMAACSFDAGPDASILSGSFSLQTYQNKALPFTEFEIPTRYGSGSGCFAVVTGGELGLDPKRAYFLITIRRQDTCGITSFGDPAVAEGYYVQQQSKLHLYATVGPGQTIPFLGTITAKTITVATPEPLYTFAR
jgi:hypothetical protein